VNAALNVRQDTDRLLQQNRHFPAINPCCYGRIAPKTDEELMAPLTALPLRGRSLNARLAAESAVVKSSAKPIRCPLHTFS
jgi:hypothetical protein